MEREARRAHDARYGSRSYEHSEFHRNETKLVDSMMEHRRKQDS